MPPKGSFLKVVIHEIENFTFRGGKERERERLNSVVGRKENQSSGAIAKKREDGSERSPIALCMCFPTNIAMGFSLHTVGRILEREGVHCAG